MAPAVGAAGATIPPTRLVGYERVEKAMLWLRKQFSGEEVGGDYGEIEGLRAAGPKMATAEFAKVIRAIATFHETDLDLAAIRVPTLVVYGEHEPAFLRRQAAFLGEAIPDATVREIPDAAHASNLDSPEVFTRTVRAFLAGALSGRWTDAEVEADGVSRDPDE